MIAKQLFVCVFVFFDLARGRLRDPLCSPRERLVIQGADHGQLGGASKSMEKTLKSDEKEQKSIEQL